MEQKNQNQHTEDTGFIQYDTNSNTDTSKNTPQESAPSETIVFAKSGNTSNSRHTASSTVPTVSSGKSRIIAIAAACGVCVVGIVVALIIAMSGSNGGGGNTEVVPVVNTSSEVSSEENESIVGLPSIPEPTIKEVDTNTIVFGKNVTVEGVSLEGLSLTQAYNKLSPTLTNIRDDINITIQCDGKTLVLTEDDFSFDYDASDILRQAYHYSRGELDNPTVSYTQNNGVTDFPVSCAVNADSINNAIKKVKEKFNIDPVDAHVSKFDPTAVEKFTYADGKDGYVIDEKSVKEQVEEILSREYKVDTLRISTSKKKFTVTLEEIKKKTKLIASHCTTSVSSANSNHNMKLALESANGKILQPGEIFSFNETTGDTTNGSLGYVPSTAIVQGQYVQQYGGGICQASTTIYIAALKADMEILERYAHAYKSAYADRGLDATIDYGYLDMRFKNTSKYPIYIATYYDDRDNDGLPELMVEFYGAMFEDFDEVVPVGWVTYADSSSYSAKGAKVYFKDGKEIKRVNLPSGSYNYSSYESQYYVSSLIPYDISYGPTDVQPTNAHPTVYSPGGCGSSAIYDDDEPSTPSETSKPETSKPETSKPESSVEPEPSTPESSVEPEPSIPDEPEQSSEPSIPDEPESSSEPSTPESSDEPEPSIIEPSLEPELSDEPSIPETSDEPEVSMQETSVSE